MGKVFKKFLRAESGLGERPCNGVHGEPMNSGLPLTVVTSWAAANGRLPVLLMTLNVATECLCNVPANHISTFHNHQSSITLPGRRDGDGSD